MDASTRRRPLLLLSALVAVGALIAPAASPAGAATGSGEAAAGAAAITPAPERATQDTPRYYDARSTLDPWKGRRCHVDAAGTHAVVCEFGRTSARYTVALVGDSKIGMYAPAFIQIANSRGWRLLTITKSSCAFSDAVNDRGGKPYTACSAWNRSALKALERHDVDLVVTGQRASTGRLPGGTKATSAAMQQGLASRWRSVQLMGIPVIVLLDNPAPPSGDVYKCVAKNRTQTWKCSFSATTSATATVQQRAADSLKGVGVIAMRPTLCPGGRCRAVVDDVLVYREGSHLTNTYVKTIVRTISKKLDAAREVASRR